MELMEKIFGSYTLVFFWIMVWIAIAALIVGSIALYKVLNNDNLLPPRPEGIDGAFLIGSQGGGVLWTDSLTLPAANNGVIQAPFGINFLNPLGVQTNDVFKSNTLTNFGSFDVSDPHVVDVITGNDIPNESVLSSIALKSDRNSTATVQLGGQLMMDTQGVAVQPIVQDIGLQTATKVYGAVNIAIGDTAVPSTVLHSFCTMEAGTLEFWYIDNNSATQRLTVTGTAASNALISFLINYPLNMTPGPLP